MITAFVIACALILIEAGIIAFLACVVGDLKKDAAKYYTPIEPIPFKNHYPPMPKKPKNTIVYEEESAK